ncbi:MAG: hypothetical protein RR553_09700 [Akkermansia sp.]
MIAILYISFDRDGLALLQSVRSARRTFGEEVNICIYDDATNPLDEAILDVVRPYYYAKTTWARGGNLNGIAAVEGVLSCFADVVNRTCADFVIKIDCDTIIQSTTWLDFSGKWALQGFTTIPPCLAQGMCYCLRADAPTTILNAIKGRTFVSNATRQVLHEDSTISFLTTIYFPGAVRIYDTAAGAVPRRVACGVHYLSNELLAQQAELIKSYDVVTFGDRWTIPQHVQVNQRHLVAR